MARYPRGTVNNNWDKYQDADETPIARIAPPPPPTLAMLRRRLEIAIDLSRRDSYEGTKTYIKQLTAQIKAREAEEATPAQEAIVLPEPTSITREPVIADLDDRMALELSGMDTRELVQALEYHQEIARDPRAPEILREVATAAAQQIRTLIDHRAEQQLLSA